MAQLPFDHLPVVSMYHTHLHPGLDTVLPKAKVSRVLYIAEPSLGSTHFLVSPDVGRPYSQGLMLREMLVTWILPMVFWLWVPITASSTTTATFVSSGE